MASATTLLKSAFLPNKSEWFARTTAPKPNTASFSLNVRALAFSDELVKTAKTMASPGRGLLAMDESNATCGKRLASIGVDNTEENRQAYRTLLSSAPGLGQYISGSILFEETLYQSTPEGKKIVDVLIDQNIVPGIKVDKGLVPLGLDESFLVIRDQILSMQDLRSLGKAYLMVVTEEKQKVSMRNRPITIDSANVVRSGNENEKIENTPKRGKYTKLGKKCNTDFIVTIAIFMVIPGQSAGI